jgi:hypothetical protein
VVGENGNTQIWINVDKNRLNLERGLWVSNQEMKLQESRENNVGLECGSCKTGTGGRNV